jgi:hypothetical protein
VPAQPGCYTKELALAAPDLIEKANRQQESSKQNLSASESQPTLQIRPAYAKLSLIDAVDLIMNDCIGQVLTTELVATALYGKVSGSNLSEAKAIVAVALEQEARFTSKTPLLPQFQHLAKNQAIEQILREKSWEYPADGLDNSCPTRRIRRERD